VSRPRRIPGLPDCPNCRATVEELVHIAPGIAAAKPCGCVFAPGEFFPDDVLEADHQRELVTDGGEHTSAGEDSEGYSRSKYGSQDCEVCGKTNGFARDDRLRKFKGRLVCGHCRDYRVGQGAWSDEAHNKQFGLDSWSDNERAIETDTDRSGDDLQ